MARSLQPAMEELADTAACLHDSNFKDFGDKVANLTGLTPNDFFSAPISGTPQVVSFQGAVGPTIRELYSLEVCGGEDSFQKSLFVANEWMTNVTEYQPG
eukprot:CAMPEP_0117691208 /NCGR_PEP_ID=MMETSP0804-20121206/25574_1 /TAXON_ID=1074897 /ORGANISM="Tetraselmis astigmatica, Strain CCMP880" /LENGTH=99 /DNA_ID=CAMNT_0005504379 /DNA_START=508 /DNA_END=803 /DNA_ORIENTATION=+